MMLIFVVLPGVSHDVQDVATKGVICQVVPVKYTSPSLLLHLLHVVVLVREDWHAHNRNSMEGGLKGAK